MLLETGFGRLAPDLAARSNLTREQFLKNASCNLWDNRPLAHYFHRSLDPQRLIWQPSIQCSFSGQVQVSLLHELPLGRPAKASHEALPLRCCVRPPRGDQPRHPATVTIQGTAELNASTPVWILSAYVVRPVAYSMA